MRKANEAFNRGDVDGFLGFCAADVEIEDLNNAPDLPQVAHGVDEVRQTLSAWLDAFDDFAGEIAEYIEAGDHVACVVDYHGKSRATGLVTQDRLIDLWRFRDGKLIRGTLGYRDRESALKAVEQQTT